MSKKKRPPTVLEVMLARVGFRKTSKTMEFLVCYAVARASLLEDGEWPEQITARMGAAAAWWKESESTWHRHLRVYREAFPEYHDPEQLVAIAEERLGDRYRPEAILAVGLA